MRGRRRRRRVPSLPNPYPWRRVVEAGYIKSGRGSLLGGDTIRRTRWRELTLECGHVVERTVRYCPSPNARVGGTQWHRTESEVLPPPKKVRCECCPKREDVLAAEAKRWSET